MAHGQYRTVMEQQRQATIAASARKGQKATNKASRQLLEIQFCPRPEPAAAGGTLIRTCFIGFSYPPCTKPLSELQQIAISQLRLETHHTGKILIIRTFGHPFRIQSIQNAIEDKEGNVDRLAVYNGDPKLKPSQGLPKNTLFAIKEPFYKATVDGGYNVRVDHPSDLVLLRPLHTMVPLELTPRLLELDKDVFAWKKEGNEAYKRKDYLGAIDLYDQGISYCSEADALVRYDLLRNCSIANLYMQRYEPALRDALDSIVPDVAAETSQTDASVKNNAKAHYRAGCAAYHLHNYVQARSCFTEVLNLTPGDKDALRELARVELRRGEQSEGKFDFASMSKSLSRTHNRLDHASFISKVDVRQAGMRGRGLFAMAEIRAGDIVFVEKAFGLALESDADSDLYVVMNLNTNRISLGTHATLLFSLIQKMVHNPQEVVRFFDLFDGGYQPKCTAQIVDGFPAIDTFQAAAIVSRNSFGCAPDQKTDASRDQKPSKSSGIWITASYMNHACTANAFRTFIGDMMIVRSTTAIGKDEEITISYKDVASDLAARQKDLQEGWCFTCGCTLCAAEAQVTATRRGQRRALVQEAKSFMEAHTISQHSQPDSTLLKQAEKLLHKIEATYDEHIYKGLPRLGLVGLSHWVCMANHTALTPQRVIESAKGVLRNCGYITEIANGTLCIDRAHCYLHNFAIDAAMYAAHAFEHQKKSRIGKQFEELGREMYQTYYGKLHGFEKRYGSPVLEV